MLAFLVFTMIRWISCTLVFPAMLIWAVGRFVLDVSLTYLVRCVYLESLLAVRSGFARRSAVANGCVEVPKKSSATGKTTLRGVQVMKQLVPPRGSVQEKPAGEVFTKCDKPKKSIMQGMPFHFGRPAREEIAVGAIEDDAWLHRRECLRQGAEVHRQVRQLVQAKVKPGMELRAIVELVEKTSSTLVGFDPNSPLSRGWAFPTGLSLNEVAAHDTVNPGDARRYLQANDLAKLDFGVHVEGHILDCAFTFTFDAMHDELMEAVREATNAGIRFAGPDALVSEIGAEIQEVMEAGEVHRSDGKVLPVKSIKNLTGHSIEPYRIHAGKSLPSTATGCSARMLAGELWAIETFGSAGGVGYVGNQGTCSHFMRPSGGEASALQKRMLSDSAKSLLSIVDRRFGTLAFCPRWVVQEAARCKSPLLEPSDQRWWSAPLEELCTMGVVQRYPPLADVPGCHTAQYEHTVLLGASGKEVLTRGSDY